MSAWRSHRMRVHIVVTSDEGISYEGDAELAPSDASGAFTTSAPTRSKDPLIQPSAADPDFDLPVRAFAKRYARSLSGPRKYAVLVARLCEGQIGKTISPREVERQWRSMTEPMGGDYNPAYASRAKNEGWVDAV